MKKIVPSSAVLIPDEAECKFQGVIYDVYQWQQELFDGSKTTFEMLRRPDTVVVICIVDDKILVIKDEQPHSGMRLGFPGGRVDDEDQDILLAAKREVCEETGYMFDQWRLVNVFQPHTKIEWFVHIFVARGVVGTTDVQLDAGEKIIVDLLPFDEVRNQVFKKIGYLGDARTVFEKVDATAGLFELPEFTGKEIKR